MTASAVGPRTDRRTDQWGGSLSWPGLPGRGRTLASTWPGPPGRGGAGVRVGYELRTFNPCGLM